MATFRNGHSRSPSVAAVMVVGGGIGGMRAALDLADAGLKVYLVEQTPCLGGRVAQLGYMFPQHDCVLCRGISVHGYGCTRPSISPAYIHHNQHPNIDLMTNTHVIDVVDQAGESSGLRHNRCYAVARQLHSHCHPPTATRTWPVSLIHESTHIFTHLPVSIRGSLFPYQTPICPCPPQRGGGPLGATGGHRIRRRGMWNSESRRHASQCGVRNKKWKRTRAFAEDTQHFHSSLVTRYHC
jgi:hypothetical protein